MIDSTALDISSSERGSGFVKETEDSIQEGTNMKEMFPGSFSVSKTSSEVSEKIENFGEVAVKMKEMDSQNVALSETGAEFCGEGGNFGYEGHKREEVETAVLVAGSIDGSSDTCPEKQAFDGCNSEKEENSVLSGEENFNFEEKGKEMEIKCCLEAEKKRLLAELEVGTIFKANVEKATSSPHSFEIKTMENMRVKDNHAFVGGSLKVEAIDGTSSIDEVPAYNNGNDHHPKWLETARADGKQTKRTRRKGKGNDAKMVEVNQGSIQVSEFHNLCQKNGNQIKMAYTRKQMEAMRFANILDQRNLWRDIYTGLSPEVMAEYKGLACSKDQNPLPNCDCRLPILNRDRAITILGENVATEIEETQDNPTSEDNVVEEDYAEDDDDSENDYDSILKPAFAVEGEPDFDSGPPEDGLEYLRRVRWEAKQIPNVKVVKMDRAKYTEKEQSVYMPQIPEIPRCPEHLLPLKEWEEALLHDFSNLRMALSQLDGKYLPGETIISSTQLEEHPTVSLIRRMDSVRRVTMLRKRICLVETMNSLERKDCEWLFALCAAVETPLDGDTCASLRGLLRKCASIRAAKSEVDDEVIMANILATISGRYFGQMESS